MREIPVQPPIPWLFDQIDARLDPVTAGALRAEFAAHNQTYSRACELGRKRVLLLSLRSRQAEARNIRNRDRIAILARRIAVVEAWIVRTLAAHPDWRLPGDPEAAEEAADG